MSLNSKLVLPVALGLSLVTVTAFVVYYVFKKDEEETNGDKKIKTSRVNVIEVQVPKSIVPALIGRGGENIKGIEKKTGAQIHFKKFSDKDYDVCILRGRSEATQIAETLIHDFIKQQPEIVEDTISVPSWACGRIIGAGGETINDISHSSGARVKLEGTPGQDGGMRQITIRGTKEQIKHATRMVKDCVAQEKCRREIEQSSRSPRHATTAETDQLPGTGRAKRTRTDASGSAIEVYVSAVSSPSRFWVQLVGPQVAQLDALVNQMTEYYGDKDNRANHGIPSVSVGQLVAAVFRHDGRWYRARVHDVRPNEFDSTQMVADVFFVDYGDSEYVATHELCELRADLLRLRFQAMECFLAGVRPPVQPDAPASARWPHRAVERFEELAQVARWKTLVSRTCAFKKTPVGEGEKEKEIPGIKLFDVTEEGELDIGAALIEEGLALSAPDSPRPSPPPPARTPTTPFGDLGNSMVLSMAGGERAASLPKDHKNDNGATTNGKENEGMSTSKSMGSGLENNEPKSISNFSISYPDSTKEAKPHQNGSGDFLDSERQSTDHSNSSESKKPLSPIRDEFKANMNRIDSHHGNLEALGQSQNELHKY